MKTPTLPEQSKQGKQAKSNLLDQIRSKAIAQGVEDSLSKISIAVYKHGSFYLSGGLRRLLHPADGSELRQVAVFLTEEGLLIERLTDETPSANRYKLVSHDFSQVACRKAARLFYARVDRHKGIQASAVDWERGAAAWSFEEIRKRAQHTS